MFCQYLFFSKAKTFFSSPQQSYYQVLILAHKNFYLSFSWLKTRFLYYTNNWIYTTNHKRIAINYFWFVILSGIFGMVLATVIRLELAYPGVGIFAGDSLQYLSLATAHGVIMVFFMIIPLISGAFANFLLPTQLGVHDVAFPRLNSAAFWFLPGGLMMLGQLICLDRRYQRMNCFNIREAQSLLKKRFFIDLITSTEQHTLLTKTMLGLRYKTSDLQAIQGNEGLFSTYNLSKLSSNKYSTTQTLPRSFFFSLRNSNVTLYSNTFVTQYVVSKLLLIDYLDFFKVTYLPHHWFAQNFLLFYDNFGTAFNQSDTTLMHRLIRSSFLKSFNRIITQSTLYKSLPARLNLDVLNLSIFFDPFQSDDAEKEITRLLRNIQHQLNYVNTNYIITPLYQSASTMLTHVRNLIKFIPINYNFAFIKTNEHLSKELNKMYNPFVNSLSFFDDTHHETGIKSQYLVIRSFNDYWASTLNSVWGSATFVNLGFKKIRTLFTLNMYHHNYFNFTSLWYFNVVFNTDELYPIGCAGLFSSQWDFLYNYIYKNIKALSHPSSTHFYSVENIWDIISSYRGAKFLYAAEMFEVFSLFSISYLFTFPLPSYSSNYYVLIKTPTQLLSNVLNVQQSQILQYTNFSKKTSYTDLALNLLYINEESLEQSRGLRFNSPVFCYDYRAGDYFPKYYQENLTYLLPTFAKLTGGVRTPVWFFATSSFEAFTLNLNNFFQTSVVHKLRKSFYVNPRLDNRNSPTYFFYNLFASLHNTKQQKTPYYWTPFVLLSTKFEELFVAHSTQERMYSNWRQLKFTREAWRCKLLIARNQKSLFRRYVRETGLFWSIERNARDLLPGWALITPFSSRPRFTAIGKVDIGVCAILLVLVSSIISGANFVVTYRYLSTLNNRKMRDARSFFTEGIMCSSWMMIAANPMLMIGLIMLLSDRHWQTSFFDYSGGGDTILFQHMFWFFGHPEVYIVIIPTFGFVNTLFSYYLRKRISARASLLYSIYTIAFLGFFVWGHHMYMVGLSHTTRMLFSTLTVMISVPAATKLMHWCVTMVNSSFVVELPFLFVLTYVFLFVSGGISGMCVAHTGMDILFHDTFYVIGHFHVMFAGAAMFGCFGAFYFYFSAIFGVKYSRVYAYMHFIYYLMGQLLTVIPMFWLGYAGMPRRVLDYPSAFGGWHSIITAGHLLSVAGLVSFFMMIFDSLRQSKAATRTTLGIIRYNTRLNFYFYEISRICVAQQKGSYQYRYFHPASLKLHGFHYTNFESLETTLYSYTLIKRL